MRSFDRLVMRISLELRASRMSIQYLEGVWCPPTTM